MSRSTCWSNAILMLTMTKTMLMLMITILYRREQAVIEQPAGAARGRNLRDAILKKEQVCDDDDDLDVYCHATRLSKLLLMNMMKQS